MLNICIVSYEFPPFPGGVSVYTYALSKAISNFGHNVSVIASGIEGQTNPNKYKFGVRYIDHIKKFPLKLFSFSIKAKKQISKMHKLEKFDLIHHTYDHFTTLPKLKVPIVATIHHPYTYERKFYMKNTNFTNYLNYLITRKSYFSEKMQKRLCKKVDKIIAVSRYTSKNIIEEFCVPRHKVDVIPNGVDINRFNPKVNGNEMRKKWCIKSDPIVLFVGVLEPHKGIDYLIKSFSKVIKDIPSAKLIIAGDGSQRNYIMNLINTLKLKNSIKLIGRVSNNDLPKIYASSDIVVLPSLMEGFGIVLLEAMASGKVCIAAKSGGVVDVIKNGKTGFLVPPADSDSLYKAICNILIDEDLLQKVGIASRKRVEKKFTWDSIAKRTLAVYEKML